MITRYPSAVNHVVRLVKVTPSPAVSYLLEIVSDFTGIYKTY